MKVDFSAGMNRYTTNAGRAAKKEAASAELRGKTDVIEFSRSTSAGVDRAPVSIKFSVIRSADAPASAERLQDIAVRVKSGTYRIPTEDLVDAILDTTI